MRGDLGHHRGRNPIPLAAHLQRICDANATVFVREVMLDMAVKALRGIPQNAEISELAGILERLGTAAHVSPREPRADSSTEPHGGASRKGTWRATAVRPDWPVRDVEIGAIIADPDVQPRAKLDEKVEADYAELMEDGADFPPLTVFEDQASHGLILADGFHRLGAARRVGKTVVWAEVRPGTRRDAVLFGVGANAAHGPPRSRADKRRAVAILVQDPEWGSGAAGRSPTGWVSVTASSRTLGESYLALNARWEGGSPEAARCT